MMVVEVEGEWGMMRKAKVPPLDLRCPISGKKHTTAKKLLEHTLKCARAAGDQKDNTGRGKSSKKGAEAKLKIHRWDWDLEV